MRRASQPTNYCFNSCFQSERMGPIRSKERIVRTPLISAARHDNRSHSVLSKAFRCFSVALLIANACLGASKLNVVTATEDLAAIGQEIGGDHVNIESIARGYQDPHFVEPKPSFLLKLQKADMLALVGLELEIGW